MRKKKENRMPVLKILPEVLYYLDISSSISKERKDE
jgi:hypothetical protein